MKINTTQLRSFIEPVWQEISSLWSGAELSFYDPTLDFDAQLEPAHSARSIVSDAYPGITRGYHERCS